MARKPKAESEIPEAAAGSTSSLTPTGASQSTSLEDIVAATVQPNEAPDAKKRKPNPPRIGQACDRCRVRKLTCDAAIVCGYCLKALVPCTTTDRLTGRKYPRGELERLERNAVDQVAHIRKLEAHLHSLGEVVPPYEERYPTTAHLIGIPSRSSGDYDDSPTREKGGKTNGPSQVSHSSQYTQGRGIHPPLILPDLRAGLVGRFLGVISNPSSSSTHEAKLNILGWEIDINAFISDSSGRSVDFGTQAYNISYRSFIASVFGSGSRIPKVELLPRDEVLAYASAYFQMLNAFLPVLHKPAFMTLLTRIYDVPSYSASSAEMVMVHMMLAMMLFQSASRNWEDTPKQKRLQVQSNLHYHYSLSMVSNLMVGQTLEDMQALAMICAHVRSLPNPEICWSISNIAISKAIELGLHRSASSAKGDIGQKDKLHLEIRKRVFWSLIAILVTVSGKIARPMPLRVEDFDIEFPEPVDDRLPGETGVNSSVRGTCSFLIGIEAFKLEPIFMELYNEVYSPRRSPSSYVDFVRQSERKLKMWCNQWPVELREDPHSTDWRLKFFTQYLNLWALEFRLLLRHPSLSCTVSAKHNVESLRECLEICHEMMGRAQILQQARGLDTTWCSCAVYICAIQTTLYGHSQLKHELTREGLNLLKADMEVWLTIMGDLGNLLGTGKRLQQTIQKQIDASVSYLEKYLESILAPKLPTTKQETLSTSTVHDAGHSQDNITGSHAYKPYAIWTQESSTDEYHDPYKGSTGSFQSPSSYHVAEHGYSIPSHGESYPAVQSSYIPSPYSTQLAQQAPYQQQPVGTTPQYLDPNIYDVGPQSWSQFTQARPSLQAYDPANTLLQLSGQGEMVKAEDMGEAGPAAGTVGLDTGEMWPWSLIGQPPGSL